MSAGQRTYNGITGIGLQAEVRAAPPASHAHNLLLALPMSIQARALTVAAPCVRATDLPQEGG